MVTEDDVVARVASDAVAASQHAVTVRGGRGVNGRHRHVAGVASGTGGEAHLAEEHRVEAGIAVGDVVAAVAVNLVVAAAAREVVVSLATADHIVIEPTIERHAAERGAGVEGVPVVAGDHREVAAILRRRARHVVVLATVLRRVAVDDQRGCQRHGRARTHRWPHRDGVATGTAVDDRDAALHAVRRHRAGDGEGVVARPEQDIEDFRVVIRDAARAAETGQRGAAECANVVRRAAIVEDVKTVDRRRLLDRRKVEAERAGVRLGRQDDRPNEGAIRTPAGEPLDRQRSADRAHDVRLQRERQQLRCGGRVGGANDRQRHVARDAERVVAEVTDGRRRHGRARAEDEERVVAFHAVDFERLHLRVASVETAPEHASVGDDERVAELGAQSRDRVEPTAAVDGDVRVQVVQHGDRWRSTALIGQRKRAKDEGIVVAFAVELQLGLIAVDGERVVPGAAVGDRRVADAAAQLAARRRGRGECVFRCHVRKGPWRAEQLPELERVAARAAVERRRGAVVVAGEVVVTAEAVDQQPAVDVDVVVDALDVWIERVRHRLGHGAVQQGDERRVFGPRPADQVARTPQQVQVGCGAAVDRQRVEAVRLRARVQHVDDVIARRAGLTPGRVDGVDIGAGLPVEVQCVASRRHTVIRCDERARGRHRLQLIHREGVGAAAAVGEGLAAQVGLVERERVGVAVAEEGGAVGGPRARRERAAQVHRGAETRVGVGVVAVHGDVLAGADRVPVRRREVVADPQPDRAAGSDEAVRDAARRVLGEQHTAGRQQVQILGERTCDRAFAHRQPDVAAAGDGGVDRRSRLNQHQRPDHLREVDGVGRFQPDITRRTARRVDLDVATVTARLPDAAADGLEVDRVRLDYGRVGRKPGQRAAVEDRTHAGRQRDIALRGIHQLKPQVARRFGDADVVHRACVEQSVVDAAVAVGRIDFEEVGVAADATERGEQRDVRANHVGAGVGQCIDDGSAQRGQRDIAAARADQPHPQVARILSERHRAIHVHVHVPGAEQVAEAHHAHGRQRQPARAVDAGVGRTLHVLDDDVAAGEQPRHRAGARRVEVAEVERAVARRRRPTAAGRTDRLRGIVRRPEGGREDRIPHVRRRDGVREGVHLVECRDSHAAPPDGAGLLHRILQQDVDRAAGRQRIDGGGERGHGGVGSQAGLQVERDVAIGDADHVLHRNESVLGDRGRSRWVQRDHGERAAEVARGQLDAGPVLRPQHDVVVAIHQPADRRPGRLVADELPGEQRAAAQEHRVAQVRNIGRAERRGRERGVDVHEVGVDAGRRVADVAVRGLDVENRRGHQRDARLARVQCVGRGHSARPGHDRTIGVVDHRRAEWVGDGAAQDHVAGAVAEDLHQRRGRRPVDGEGQRDGRAFQVHIRRGGRVHHVDIVDPNRPIPVVRNQHLAEAVAERPRAAAASDRQRAVAGKRAGAHAVVEERLAGIVVGDVVDEDFRLGHDLAAGLVRVLARPHRDVHRRLDDAVRGDDQLRAAAREDIDVGVPDDRSRLAVDGLLARSAAGQRLLAVLAVAVDARDLVRRVDV